MSTEIPAGVRDALRSGYRVTLPRRDGWAVITDVIECPDCHGMRAAFIVRQLFPSLTIDCTCWDCAAVA